MEEVSNQVGATSPHGVGIGEEWVVIAGVGVSGYNGTYFIQSVPSSTTFTYLDLNTLLANSSGGTATQSAPTVAYGTPDGGVTSPFLPTRVTAPSWTRNAASAIGALEAGRRRSALEGTLGAPTICGRGPALGDTANRTLVGVGSVSPALYRRRGEPVC